MNGVAQREKVVFGESQMQIRWSVANAQAFCFFWVGISIQNQVGVVIQAYVGYSRVITFLFIRDWNELRKVAAHHVFRAFTVRVRNDVITITNAELGGRFRFQGGGWRWSNA